MAMNESRLKAALDQALNDSGLADTLTTRLLELESDDTSLDAIQTLLATTVQADVTFLEAATDRLSGGCFTCSFAVGAEDGGDAIVVAVQALDENGAACAVRTGLTLYILADANGDAFNTGDYTIAAGTDGAILQTVADKIIHAITEADGDLDVSLTIAGGATCYLAHVGPTGKLSISAAITHAA